VSTTATAARLSVVSIAVPRFTSVAVQNLDHLSGTMIVDVDMSAGRSAPSVSVRWRANSFSPNLTGTMPSILP
jgi:hypothetical protein